ncbi:unnamed protein product [Didymodactylos carnosus]|uniref:Uncharacterized protein n=1 Tax=Didymodactylos carnosus TaxID=1234261 RepID=A0A8S2WM59_9BILA|nr:unnamed protein product [Didymodactylos carnosus]CAF4450665.1 unnamed protein product [Didymodactylos carnosus]
MTHANRTPAGNESLIVIFQNFRSLLADAPVAISSGSNLMKVDFVKHYVRTEQSQKIIKPLIRLTQQLLGQDFEDQLHSISQVTLVKHVQHKLITDAQAEFDQNKTVELEEFKSDLY